MFVTGLKIARGSAAVNQQTVRTLSSIVTKPRARVSFFEKCVHGVIMTVGILAVPSYIAINFKKYSGRAD